MIVHDAFWSLTISPDTRTRTRRQCCSRPGCPDAARLPPRLNRQQTRALRRRQHHYRRRGCNGPACALHHYQQQHLHIRLRSVYFLLGRSIASTLSPTVEPHSSIQHTHAQTNIYAQVTDPQSLLPTAAPSAPGVALPSPRPRSRTRRNPSAGRSRQPRARARTTMTRKAARRRPRQPSTRGTPLPRTPPPLPFLRAHPWSLVRAVP